MNDLYEENEFGGRTYHNETANELWLRGCADEIIEAFEEGLISCEECVSMIYSEEIRNNNFNF